LALDCLIVVEKLPVLNWSWIAFKLSLKTFCFELVLDWFGIVAEKRPVLNWSWIAFKLSSKNVLFQIGLGLLLNCR
jgi:hypothetical protein